MDFCRRRIARTSENKAAELCRQLRHEQAKPQFQGQQLNEHQQQQDQIILLRPQNQEQKLRRSLSKSFQCADFNNGVLHSSSPSASLPDPTTFMSAPHNRISHHNHQQQQKHRQQDDQNECMNNIYLQHQQQTFAKQQQRQHDAPAEAVEGGNGPNMVLVSKDTISNLTDQIMNKMKELEERVNVISAPYYTGRCNSNSSSSGGSSIANPRANHFYSMQSPSIGGRDFDCNNGCGVASLTNNHLATKNNSVSTSNSNMLRSNQNLNTQRSSSPRVEYEDLINDLISLSYSVNYPSSTISSTKHSNYQLSSKANKRSSPSISKLDCGCQSFKEHLRYNSISREQRLQHARSQSASLQTTPTHHRNGGRKDASTNTDLTMEELNILESSKMFNSKMDDTKMFSSSTQNRGTADLHSSEEEIECDRSDIGSMNGEGPYSIGSSYQDPSDFEEYCAYGESLDRRTKDFMSQSTKIPNDLRFALIRLNDFIINKPDTDSSGFIEVIRKEWFDVAANKDSQPTKTKLYVDYFESFTKQLLNTVVNLCDHAGNTAMHYAASLFKLDIIEVLLNTKVCDVNRRNKAGYTPIMLLALAEITDPVEQEIARQLFSMGDVNIKARTNGQTAIMLAASHGRISTCKLLLECGADPSLQDYEGSTALMCGSEIGDEEVVRCLLAHRLTDPNAVDNDGLDALTIAMNNGHKNIGLILYAAKNVMPRMVRSAASNPIDNSNSSGYLGASLRRSRGKVATNYVRRADSLLGSRTSCLARHSQT